MLSETSSETEFRREQNARLLAAIESKKARFPRMVALIGNEIRFCELGTDQKGFPKPRYTYKVFDHRQMEQAIEWVESL